MPEQTPQDPGYTDRMGRNFGCMAVLVALAVLTMFFNSMLADRYNPNRHPVSTTDDGGVREVVLQQNRYGSYITHGQINGERVTFLVDTGASSVAVPLSLARKLSLSPGRQTQVQTANGVTTGYITNINSVSVGGVVLRNVEGLISAGLQDDQVLLGMSFLGRLDLEQREGVLTLRQYP